MARSVVLCILCIALHSAFTMSQDVMTCGSQLEQSDQKHQSISGNLPTEPPKKMSSCQSHFNLGERSSQLYQIWVTGSGSSRMIEVYCDQVTGGGGWMHIQRRTDGSEDFYRNWEDYRQGFGNKSNEFWMGLDVVHDLTNDKPHELRIDMESFEDEKAYANYKTFRVGPRSDNYRLEVGGYSGNAGDSLEDSNGQQFSTMDRDRDTASLNCAIAYHGAWWYNDCGYSNLNGNYLARKAGIQSVNWFLWKNINSLKAVDMKIRPVSNNSF